MNREALTKKRPERAVVPPNIVREQRGGTPFPAWTLLIGPLWLILLWSGCMSAAKKAQKEAEKIEDARQKEIKQLEKMRKQYPCDTSSTVIDTTTAIRFLPGETITRNDTTFRTDTVEHIRIVNKQHTVVDSGAVKQMQDSLNSARYLFRKANDSTAKVNAELRHDNAIYKASAEKWDKLVTWLSIIGIAAGIAAMVILFFKMKSKIGL